MKTLRTLVAVAAGTGVLALVGATAARAAAAEPEQQQNSQTTPSKWNWEIRDGKRVPKGERQTNADGSWRETVKVGACTTIKEHSPAGEYRESRRCD